MARQQPGDDESLRPDTHQREAQRAKSSGRHTAQRGRNRNMHRCYWNKTDVQESY